MKNHHHNGPIHPTSRTLIHEEIAVRAYEIWERDGRPTDQDEAIWLAAELELTSGHAAPPRGAGLPVSF